MYTNRVPRQAQKKEDGTLDDRRIDGGTNSNLRTKEQGTHLTLNQHDDEDDEIHINFCVRKPCTLAILSITPKV